MNKTKSILYVFLAVVYFVIAIKLKECFRLLFTSLAYLFNANEVNFNDMVDAFINLFDLEAKGE